MGSESEFESAFIQAPEHRPNLSPTMQTKPIPIIDLSPLLDDVVSESSSSSNMEKLVKEIGSVCKEWGFFQVINHGVPLSKRQSIEEASRRFFSQSLEEKKKVSRDERNVTGEVVQEYVDELEKLAFKLMELIAVSLGLKPKRFNGFVKNQTSLMRLSHYPPCPSPHLALGIGQHKDNSILTIVAQDDVDGLEFKSDHGEWIRVKPLPNAYLINVGDVIQVWSNDAYESIDHRVSVNSEKGRFSMIYFFFPAHDAIIEPLEEFINEENPPKYRPINWGKFLVNRLENNFKKQNVGTLQIAHFKLP